MMLNRLIIIVFGVSLVLITSCTEEKPSLEDAMSAYNDYRKEIREASRWDLSDSLVQAKISGLEDISSRLTELDRSRLDSDDLINYDMLKLIIDDQLYNLKYGSYLMPLNAEGGFITGLIYSAQSARLRDEKSISGYEDQMKGIPDYINDQITRMNEGIAKGKVCPQVVVKNCIRILDQQLNGDKESTFLHQPLSGLEDENRSLIAEIINKEAIPALANLRSYLQNTYMRAAREQDGVSVITDGKKYYEQRVQYFTTLDMSPEEVFQTGLSEVARIKSEMQSIIDQLGFKGSYADFLKFLRTDSQFYAQSPQELLDHAAWFSKKAEEILPRYFGKLPRLPFTVNPVPAAIAPTYTSGRYSPGSYEDHRAGQYWVNTYKLESRPLYALPALTLHEAVPGHHLQGALVQEMDEVPSFRNTYISAYGEGWGLYCEYLGKEAGIYTTPYEDFGRLTYEMWRACRLVVDPGIHYKGWDRQKAIDYMASNTALSIHEVTTEIDRYIGWPGQAVSYKIGELKIRELRKRAEEALGNNFNIRSFHDKILENGAMPLKTLEHIIDRFIEEEKTRES